MARKQNDLTQLKNNKTGVKFNDLERILKQHGWEHQSTTGSHHVYSKAGWLPIMVVRPHGKQKHCHPMDVNKVITALETEQEVEETEDEPEDNS